MTTWFSSDHHFFHQNIIKFCDRPFDSVEEMNRVMVERWNAVVQPSDTGYILGDIALGHVDEALALTQKMNGRKILVAGNHDRCSLVMAKNQDAVAKWRERYLNEGGFDEIILQWCAIELHHEGRTKSVLLSHYPYEPTGFETGGRGDRVAEHRPTDNGLPLLCGHIHDQWRSMSEGRVINVGVDVWNFAPVHESELFEMLERDGH